MSEGELLVRRRLERHPVQRDTPWRMMAARCSGVEYPTCAPNSQPGCRASARRMKRSRETFARIDAAAIAALVESPPTIARCSKPMSGTANPSTRQTHPGRATRESASLSALRFVLCSPRLSMPGAQRETMHVRMAIRMTIG